MSHPSQDRQARIQAAGRQKRSPLPWIAAALVLVLVGAGVAFAVLQNRSRQASVDEALASATAPPNANADKSGIVVNPGKAKAGAPVVALFQDYQCPACAQLEKMYGPTLAKLAQDGSITLEYHTMTFLDDNLRNDSSQRAAEAAACADGVGVYGKYHDEVYANQPEQEGRGYTDEQLTTTFAQAAGLSGTDLDTFRACYDRHSMKNWVVGTNQKASDAKVTATPTLRVNGKDFDLRGLTGPEDFSAKLLAAGK